MPPAKIACTLLFSRTKRTATLECGQYKGDDRLRSSLSGIWRKATNAWADKETGGRKEIANEESGAVETNLIKSA